jgi:glycerol-3-phosphate dehydrogenase subunit B
MTAANSDSIECELLVIGRGMAGMAAALFAVNRGLSTVQVGMTGELIFASGLLDFFGVYPLIEKKPWDDPWAGIDLLVQDVPNHPYARLKREEIQDAFKEVLSFLEAHGLPYCSQDGRNSQVMTPAGTIKRTYCVPKTMWNGVQALKEKRPCRHHAKPMAQPALGPRTFSKPRPRQGSYHRGDDGSGPGVI